MVLLSKVGRSSETLWNFFAIARASLEWGGRTGHDGSPRRLASFGIFPNVTSIVTKLDDSVSFSV